MISVVKDEFQEKSLRNTVAGHDLLISNLQHSLTGYVDKVENLTREIAGLRSISVRIEKQLEPISRIVGIEEKKKLEDE